jgi:hypothetical protein
MRPQTVAQGEARRPGEPIQREYVRSRATGTLLVQMGTPVRRELLNLGAAPAAVGPFHHHKTRMPLGWGLSDFVTDNVCNARAVQSREASPAPQSALSSLERSGHAAGYVMDTAPRLYTLRGTGTSPSLSRAQVPTSPLFMSGLTMGKTYTHERETMAERRAADATQLRPITPRAATPQEGREKALARRRGTGVGIMFGKEAPWTSRPYKLVSGCSGIVGV